MDAKTLQKEFEKKYPLYEKTAKTASKELQKIITLPIHSVKYRLKTFESFYQKINRKKYTNPFKQCTDIIGVRVICLFPTQAENAVNIIKKNFHIIEEVRKEKAVDQFSYDAIHLVCTISKTSEIVFEIQIRTILQEAWGEIEHYLNYKKIGVNNEQLRKINAISALLELADDSFDSIITSFENQKNDPTTTTELTAESIYHSCKNHFAWAWKYPEYFKVEEKSEYLKLLKLCNKKGITTSKQFETLLEKHKNEMLNYDKQHAKDILNSKNQWPKIYEKVKATSHFFGPVMLLTILLNDLK